MDEATAGPSSCCSSSASAMISEAFALPLPLSTTLEDAGEVTTLLPGVPTPGGAIPLPLPSASNRLSAAARAAARGSVGSAGEVGRLLDGAAGGAAAAADGPASTLVVLVGDGVGCCGTSTGAGEGFPAQEVDADRNPPMPACGGRSVSGGGGSHPVDGPATWPCLAAPPPPIIGAPSMTELSNVCKRCRWLRWSCGGGPPAL